MEQPVMLEGKPYSIPEKLPLGKQKHPVLIGRMKTGEVVIQAGGRYVKIPQENIRDTSIGLIMCLPDEK